MDAKNTASDREFALTRVFEASRELVWKAWTKPEHLKHWWGPKGFTWVGCKMDVRPGGILHYCLRAPNGSNLWGKFVYREIAPPERLVFIVSFSDEAGGTTRHPLSATWPLEVLNTLTFSEHLGRTTVKLQGIPVNATEVERATFDAAHEGMRQGFAGTLDQLATYLAKEIQRSREPEKHPMLVNGKVCYLEIPAIDIQRSAAFYREVFGWQIRQRSDGHIAFDDAVGEVSGTWVVGRPAATAPGLLIYIMVDSVATTVDAVIANGGKIVQPLGMDAPEVTARFSDPAGNIIGLYQPPTGKN